MGKYIINLRDTTDRIICVGVKDGETYASGVSVSCLTPYTEPDLEQVRKEAYKDGYNSACEVIDIESRTNAAYQKGLADAWEAVKKLARMDTDTSESITGYFGLHNIMHNLTASEAIEEIRAYEQAQKEKEEQKELKVGDKVMALRGEAIITGIDKDDYVYYLYPDGATGYGRITYLKKTGRHFPDFATVLQKMRGEQDG